MAVDDEFDIDVTHQDATAYDTAEAVFASLKQSSVDPSDETSVKAYKDRVIRAVMIFDQDGRPDKIMEVLEYAHMVDPKDPNDRSLYVSAIKYHLNQITRKKVRGEKTKNDLRTPEKHLAEAKRLAGLVGLESLVSRYE